MPRSKFTAEEKYNILSKYKKGILSASQISEKYNIHRSRIYEWKRLFDIYGFKGLQESKTWIRYSKETKYNAVQDYINGVGSLKDICISYHIADTKSLRAWINKYNSHIELKSTGKRLEKNMTTARATSYLERIEITQYCIANDQNYKKTADKFNVSYQQVYTWVRRYKANGEKGLQDKRGKRKAIETLTPEEKLELKIKQLEAENNKLQAENYLLKKLEEIERRRF